MKHWNSWNSFFKKKTWNKMQQTAANSKIRRRGAGMWTLDSDRTDDRSAPEMTFCHQRQIRQIFGIYPAISSGSRATQWNRPSVTWSTGQKMTISLCYAWSSSRNVWPCVNRPAAIVQCDAFYFQINASAQMKCLWKIQESDLTFFCRFTSFQHWSTVFWVKFN